MTLFRAMLITALVVVVGWLVLCGAFSLVGVLDRPVALGTVERSPSPTPTPVPIETTIATTHGKWHTAFRCKECGGIYDALPWAPDFCLECGRGEEFETVRIRDVTTTTLMWRPSDSYSIGRIGEVAGREIMEVAGVVERSPSPTLTPVPVATWSPDEAVIEVAGTYTYAPLQAIERRLDAIEKRLDALE